MKFIHTADWHLGKIVNNIHMTEEQAYVLEQFLDIVRREEPDAIIIAGDLYDRAIPPKEAVELLNRIFTTIITELHIPILAISGNHDSPDRLEFGSDLFRKQHLYLEAKFKGNSSPVVLHDAHGPVYFHLVPYTEPAEVRSVFEDDSIQSHQQALEAIIEKMNRKYDLSERHIFIGHAFLAGGMETESEERLSMIGGTPYVDARLFEPFSYVAMGHLHQPQRIHRKTIRYSGSILKYSFSESNQQKSITVVELDQEGVCQINRIPLIPKHDMRIVEGYFHALLEDPLENKEDFLHIQLLDEGQIIDPMNKLRKIYPNILRLERKVQTSRNSLLDLQKIREKQSRSHTELFASFYEEIKGVPIPESSMKHIDKVVATIIDKERRS
ncbi:MULTISPECIES: exonuclease SbcCD subunit D [Virgibacillus]|uniref:Nuclease SbcCD subunit D n=1 Tax=Virgibacillus kapii TaxID=1638645 RepID=A0ABQ2D6X5_9BACI|nr:MULTISPECIES: exonuclease SbcCD subunit D [Virgibacillus]EQB36164.1 hypothetical protein M948_14105 [Virgibacillus sp. CM-4]GGJ46165.1 nuclease SbcCD subunit D [Virgibacillus kapii]